jgi:TRAP-type transport system small permease protein
MEIQSPAVQASEPKSGVNRFEKYTTLLSKWLYWIAGAGLIAMLALVIGDIFGIKLLAHPIPGGIEITAFLGAVVIGFAIAYVQVLHGHIQVDFFIMKLPRRARAVVDSTMLFWGILFFIVLAWRTLDYGIIIQKSGEVSMTQKIPFAPFIYGLAFCYLVTVLVLVTEFIKTIMKVGKKWTR